MRLPVQETHITMALDGTTNTLSGVFAHEGDLVASFTLAAETIDEWRVPRHVRDFADGRDDAGRREAEPLQAERDVGDDHARQYVLGGFELRDDRAELRLRKRAEAPDSLVFNMHRIEDKLSAEVHHPDDVEAESGLPAVLDDSAAKEMERLGQQLRSACGPLLAKKRRLVALSLGGADVTEHDLGTKVVALVVATIAQTVGEVARRSPNAHELSLKVENDSGRREEIYLRKAQLVSALSSVTPKERGVFDPLGLTRRARGSRWSP